MINIVKLFDPIYPTDTITNETAVNVVTLHSIERDGEQIMVGDTVAISARRYRVAKVGIVFCLEPKTQKIASIFREIIVVSEGMRSDL